MPPKKKKILIEFIIITIIIIALFAPIQVTKARDGIDEANFAEKSSISGEKSAQSNIALAGVENRTLLYQQDFNDEVVNEYLINEIWRIPSGWSALTPTVYPGGSCTYPHTSRPGLSLKMQTKHLVIEDYQSAMSTYIERPLPAVSSGYFEFHYAMVCVLGYPFENYIVLESSSGTDLLTLKGINPDLDSTWELDFQGSVVNQEFDFGTKLLVGITFNGTHADLTLNGTIQLTNIPYNSGTIENLRITTGPASGVGRGHFDDFSLYAEEPTEPRLPILDSITSPDDDGSFMISWSEVPNADEYQLYRHYGSFSTTTTVSPTFISSSTSYQEMDLADGGYYYQIEAFNSSGSLGLSNLEKVTVGVLNPPNIPDLSPADSPDTDGSFTISWTTVENAEKYDLYRSSDPFYTNPGRLLPIYSGPNSLHYEQNLEEGIYYYRVHAMNSAGWSYLSNMITVEVDSTAKVSLVYEQDFNDEIPANYNGDGVWRIPNGWSAETPATFPGGSSTYPMTMTHGGNRLINTTHLTILDYQMGTSTYIERPLPAVYSGTLEFTYYMYNTEAYPLVNNLILEDSSGTDLITWKASHSSGGRSWGVSLEGIDAGVSYTTSSDHIYVQILFSGTHAVLRLNGTLVLESVQYRSGTIANLRITTGDSGVASGGGDGHFDDFALYRGNPDGNLEPENSTPRILSIFGIVGFIGIATIGGTAVYKKKKSRLVDINPLDSQYGALYEPINSEVRNPNSLENRVGFCPNCGTPTGGRTNFCSECGYHL